MMCAALADLARERGCYGMWTATGRDNVAAQRTYASAGAQILEPQTMVEWRLGERPGPADGAAVRLPVRARGEVPGMFRMARRKVPWILVFEAALMLRKHWRTLAPPDRARLAELTRKSHGSPLRLTREERAEFRRIAGDLDLIGLVREMTPLGNRFGGRH